MQASGQVYLVALALIIHGSQSQPTVQAEVLNAPLDIMPASTRRPMLCS